MEMICDVLRVIEDGSTRPTQIMHAANLTWPPLMILLEVLLRNELLTRESTPSRSTYKLTAKGSIVLNLYLRLKEETGPLEAETAQNRRSKGLAEVAPVPGREKPLSVLRSSLTAANFILLDDVVAGRSGTGHVFDLVAKGLDRAKYGFFVLGDVDETLVMKAFVKQLDTDVGLVVAYTKRVTDEARRLANIYSISLVPARSLGAFGESLAFADAFRSDWSVLLEADPSESYEHAVHDLIRREAENLRVSVFTWRSSPIYRNLPRMENIRVYVMANVADRRDAQEECWRGVDSPIAQRERVAGLGRGGNDIWISERSAPGLRQPV